MSEAKLEAKKAVIDFEGLATVILSTLKDISLNKQRLTPLLLAQALATKQEFAELLQEAGIGEGALQEDSPDHSPTTRNPKTGRTSYRAPAVKTDTNAVNGDQGIHKRAVLAIIRELRDRVDDSMLEPLIRLKRQLLEGARFEYLQEAIDRFEEAAAKAEPFVKVGRKTGLRGDDSKPASQREEPEFSETFYHQELKTIYGEILEGIRPALDSGSLDQLSKLKKRIKETKTLRQLIDLNREMLLFIKRHEKHLTKERQQLAEFIAEIGAYLVGIEIHFKKSAQHSKEAFQSQQTFNTTLETHMDETKKSVQYMGGLEELKGFIVKKVTSIKKVIEEKNKEDERRNQEATQRMAKLLENLNSMKSEVEQATRRNQALEREALLDPLTEAHNHRAYQNRIEEELHRYKRYNQRFSLLLLDIDHFKAVNDRLGHAAGDKCLQQIVRRIQPVLRRTDFLARYGGEEFVVILPGTGEQGAMETAEKLRRVIERTHFLYRDELIPVTISVGVTEVNDSDQEAGSIFQRVDAAMYDAKSSGRNRIAKR
jgi:diguanylate cyclase (GGDEF)-like protein